MSLLLALEWDSAEARVALARKRGKEAVIEDAFTVALEPRDPGQTFVAPHVGARVAAELTARNVTRVETLVAVGRKDIELRLLNVPPAPPEELPDVVRFQALRQFTTLGEDWPLDFLPLAAPGESPTSVLAATLAPEQVKQIRAACEVGGLAPRRMVLRPMAAAALLSRQLPDRQGRCRLMIDLLSDEADLTVLEGERVVFLRTVRLPNYGDVEAQNTALLGELRRTMVAAQNQLGGRRVEYVIVCGNPTDHTSLVDRLQRELSLRAECFDPFAALPMSDELRKRLPERHGRFAPLLGMLLDEAAGTPHAIDFLNPRRRPVPKTQVSRWILAGGVAASVALLVGGYVWSMFHSVASEIYATQQALKKIEPLLKPSDQKVKDAAEIDKFVHADMTWLDELHRLSQPEQDESGQPVPRFPSGEDAIVTSLIAASREPSGGTIMLDGKARAPDVINQLEYAGRDKLHSVSGNGAQSDPKDAKYPWLFKERVVITHPDAPAPKPRGAAAPSSAAGLSTKGGQR